MKHYTKLPSYPPYPKLSSSFKQIILQIYLLTLHGPYPLDWFKKKQTFLTKIHVIHKNNRALIQLFTSSFKVFCQITLLPSLYIHNHINILVCCCSVCLYVKKSTNSIDWRLLMFLDSSSCVLMIWYSETNSPFAL